MLYAATYQRRRAQWGMNGGGPGSAIWKSTDAGRPGRSSRTACRPGRRAASAWTSIARNPNVLYARIEHPEESGVYRSDDAARAGARCRTSTRGRCISARSASIRRPIRASTCSASRCTSRTTAARRSATTAPRASTSITTRCGSTRTIRTTSSSATTAASASRTIGGDLGVDAQPGSRAQAYHVEFDMQTPYHVCAGLQDNNTWCGPSAVRTNSGIINDDWYVRSAAATASSR